MKQENYQQKHIKIIQQRNYPKFLIYKQCLQNCKAKKRDTGCVKLQTNKRRRKSILSEKDLKNISGLINSQPNIIINEIIGKLEIKVTNETFMDVHLAEKGVLVKFHKIQQFYLQ